MRKSCPATRRDHSARALFLRQIVAFGSVMPLKVRKPRAKYVGRDIFWRRPVVNDTDRMQIAPGKKERRTARNARPV